MYSDYYDGDDFNRSSPEPSCRDCWQECFCRNEKEQAMEDSSFADLTEQGDRGSDQAGIRTFLTDKMGYQPDDPGWN